MRVAREVCNDGEWGKCDSGGMWIVDAPGGDLKKCCSEMLQRNTAETTPGGGSKISSFCSIWLQHFAAAFLGSFWSFSESLQNAAPKCCSKMLRKTAKTVLRKRA